MARLFRFSRRRGGPRFYEPSRDPSRARFLPFLHQDSGGKKNKTRQLLCVLLCSCVVSRRNPPRGDLAASTRFLLFFASSSSPTALHRSRQGPSIPPCNKDLTKTEPAYLMTPRPKLLEVKVLDLRGDRPLLRSESSPHLFVAADRGITSRRRRAARPRESKVKSPVLRQKRA